jgi:hypothetical protein
MTKLVASEQARRAATLRQTVVLPPNRAAPAAPAPSEPIASTRHERYRQTRELQRKRWPAVFSAARPLAIGIDQQVRAAIGQDESLTADLKLFLRKWVYRSAYRDALARGDRRVHLDGSDAGLAYDRPAATGAAA